LTVKKKLPKIVIFSQKIAIGLEPVVDLGLVVNVLMGASDHMTIVNAILNFCSFVEHYLFLCMKESENVYFSSHPMFL